MSHESSPKQREQELQFNKFLLDSYVPVFRDIASSNPIAVEAHPDATGSQSIVQADGDLYSVSVYDVLDSQPHSKIEITRLLHQGDDTPYAALRSYTYDTLPSTRVVTTRTIRLNENFLDRSFTSGTIDEPKETMLFFGQFATIDDAGEVVLACEAVDAEKASEMRQRHEAELEKLLQRIEWRKKGRKPRVKRKLLDRILGENGNNWKWQ